MTGRGWAVLAVAAATWGPRGGQPVAGQQAPPTPDPPPSYSLPPAREATLANGAQVLVVPGDEVPLVSVTLVIPSGSATDPAGKEGVAGMVARLLGDGGRAGDTAPGGPGSTVPRATGIPGTPAGLAVLGASLSASSGPDVLQVRFRGPAAELEAGLEHMAAAVLTPAFAAGDVERIRDQALRAVESRDGRPAFLADGYFLAEVYGNHPYGRRPSATSLQAISREDLVRWHGERIRPQGALFLVTGDVTLDQAVGALERAFSPWRPGAPPPEGRAAPANRAGPEVILVHRPGATTAHVRLGHLLPVGADPDWTALRTAFRILGSGPDSRLARRLGAGPAPAVDAFATVGQRAGPGFFRAGFVAGNGQVARRLGQLFGEVERIRDQLVPPAELEEIRGRAMGERILALETPEQVADHLARDRMLGLDGGEGGAPSAGVAALTAERLRRVVRSHVRPSEVVMVVVGDAGRLGAELESFGPVRVVTPRGGATGGTGDPGVRASEDFSGAGLEPLTAEYRIDFQGRRAGTSTRTLEVLSDSLLRFGSRVALGPQEIQQSVTVRARDLVFVSSETRLTTMGGELTGALRREADRITGTLRSPAGETRIDVAAGPDVLVSDMLELAVWVADLEVGKVITVPVLDVQSGRVEAVDLRVLDRADDVPDGSGARLPEVFVVEVDGPGPQTLYARVEAPHVVLLLQPAAQPVDVLLTSLTPGVADPGGPGGNAGSEGGTEARDGGGGGP